MSIFKKHQLLTDAVKTTIADNQEMKGLASEILQKVVIDTINRYQQKLNVGVQDSVSDLLENFKLQICEEILKAISGWKVYNHDHFLLPKGCRFCFSKGDSVVVVIEQDPQIRSLFLDGKLFKPSQTNSERVSLALPYVVFVLHFLKNSFRQVYCGWRKAPLNSIDDMLANPVLPNIHENLSVCTGHMQDLGSNISEISNNVIGLFWQSKFNNDLSAKWWEKQKLHESFSQVQKWSEASFSDSTFVLDIDYPKNRSVRSIIDLLTIHEQEPDQNKLKHNFFELVDKHSESLFHKILRYFKNTKFEKYHPKEISDEMQKHMTAACCEMITLTLALENELELLKKDMRISNNSEIKPASVVWSKYSS
jgi:hypothetical protein